MKNDEFKKMNKKGNEYYKDSQKFAIGFGFLLLIAVILFFIFN